jgi:hypothetical protein
MKNWHFKKYFFMLGAFFFIKNAQATWCLPTHLLHNAESTKMTSPGEPFRIGIVDKEGYSLDVISGSTKQNYRYLRRINLDDVVFREFRSGMFKFHLAMPNENKLMTYRETLTDDKGVERGFSGYCS